MWEDKNIMALWNQFILSMNIEQITLQQRQNIFRPLICKFVASLTNSDKIKDILHEMLSCCSWKSSFSATSAICVANFSARAASSGLSIESIPSRTSSAALFVKRSGWSHIFFRIYFKANNNCYYLVVRYSQLKHKK